jgi:hypothetical protein
VDPGVVRRADRGRRLLYYVPKFIRARRGINVSFVYEELPPE